MNSNSNNNCSCGNGSSANNGPSANSSSSGKGKKRVLKVVQFMHSGKQHGIDDKQNQKKFWNRIDKHKRKFMKAEGRYVTPTGALSEPTELHFWGEWEPDSNVLATYPDKRFMPRWLHEPILNLNAKGNGVGSAPAGNANPCSAASTGTCIPQDTSCQNTDPFVFADAFYYSLCHQSENKGCSTTYLTSLAVGSVILFGSKVTDDSGNPAFALDTVFVVGDMREYSIENHKKDLAGFVPTHYDYIMGFSAMGGKFAKLPLTCYKGATPQAPVNGMFSFVPCQLAEGRTAPVFQRVLIPLNAHSGSILNHCITKSLTQGFKGTPVSPNDAQAVWNEVCKAVEAQGCLRGFDFRYQLDPAIP